MLKNKTSIFVSTQNSVAGRHVSRGSRRVLYSSSSSACANSRSSSSSLLSPRRFAAAVSSSRLRPLKKRRLACARSNLGTIAAYELAASASSIDTQSRFYVAWPVVGADHQRRLNQHRSSAPEFGAGGWRQSKRPGFLIENIQSHCTQTTSSMFNIDENDVYDPHSECWVQFTVECLARGLDISESVQGLSRKIAEQGLNCTFTQTELDARCAASYDSVFALCRSLAESTDLSFSVKKAVGRLESVYRKLRHDDDLLYEKIKKGKLLTVGLIGHPDCCNWTMMKRCTSVDSGVLRLQKSIIEIIDGPPSMDWLHRARYLNIGAARQFAKMVKQRYVVREELDKRLYVIKGQVDHHNALRHAKVGVVLSGEFLCADLLGHVFRFCGLNESIQLMRVNKEFSKNETLWGLLPQLSIRYVPGVFPHAKISGINYIANHKKVAVYLDFVVFGAANSNTAPISCDKIEPKVLHSRRDIKLNESKVKARHAPDEIVDDCDCRTRISHEHYFSTPIFCNIDLVSAETHEHAGSFSIVPAPGAPPRKGVPGAADETYTCALGDAHPAKCECFIHSTSQHNGIGKKQLFCIRAQGRALRRWFGPSEDPYHEFVTFSDPFEVVSKMSVAKNAQRRESKQRDREQKRKQELHAPKR